MMAMAELFIHEIEDPLIAYLPPAPPPSPEAQRARSNVFELPAGTFEPLELQAHALTALDFLVSGQNNSLSTVPERAPPFDSDDDDKIDFPASPQKRICNSPCSFPKGYDVQINKFGSPASAPHSKSKRHQRRSPVPSLSPPLLSVPKSDSPLHIQNHSNPFSIPLRPENGIGFTYHGTNHTLSPPSHPNVMSKSFDLHNAQLFQAQGDFMMPEVRSRAYTHDASSLAKVTDSSHQRRRKISLKRTKDERDSDLQFSFEYSTTSTGSGSSEHDDWIVVTPDTSNNLPPKKACQDTSPMMSPLPLTFAQPKQQLYTAPPNIMSLLSQVQPASEAGLTNMESVTMMDTGDFKGLESMDTTDFEPMSLTAMETQNTENHLQVQASSLGPCRLHSIEDKQANFRHSYMQENSVNSNTLEVSNGGFTFSKSL